MAAVNYWFLQETFDTLDRVGRTAVMQLCEALEMKVYKKGSIIQYEGQSSPQVYFIKKGHVKIGTKANGRFNLEYILGKADIFGDPKTTIGEEGRDYEAIAMSNCTLWIIDPRRLETLMYQYPRLHGFVLKTVGSKYLKIERRLSDILYKDAATRIRDFIFDFVVENGQRSKNIVYSQNIFSHKDIAKLTSTSRQTVNNVISKLRRTSGLIYTRKEIRVDINSWD